MAQLGGSAAIVAGGRAMLRARVPENEQATIKGMRLYALEITEGRLPGPYSTAEALA